MMKSIWRKTAIHVLLFAVFMLPVVIQAAPAEAASVASVNKKADAAFKRKAKSLARNKDYKSCRYKMIDLTGDGIHEMICECKESDGSSYTWLVYGYKNGRLWKRLSTGHYGIYEVFAYPKTKTLVLHRSGHGWEAYYYYVLKNGKTIKKNGHTICRVRSNSPRKGAWEYGNWKQLMTRKQYLQIRRKLTRGKKDQSEGSVLLAH